MIYGCEIEVNGLFSWLLGKGWKDGNRSGDMLMKVGFKWELDY